MEKVNIHEAKTHLSRLLARVESGEEIIIARAGTPIARLSAYTGTEARQRRLGLDSDIVEIPDDFDDPLPADVIDDFYR